MHSEIIVIDDGSTDSSAKIAKHYSPAVKYFFQPKGGLSSALNHGIKAAQGSFFAFLDSDDLWMKDKLTHQMAVFENHPELDIVFGQIKHFFSPELDEDQTRKMRLPAEVMPGIFKGSMLIKRESFFHVGTFDTRWKVGDFICWYSRAMEKGLRSIVLDEIVMLRRIHTNNMGIRERESQNDFVKILKASLDRRRRMPNADKDL
jgi:glycosyltransferase involved in cell wall biosynthesis